MEQRKAINFYYGYFESFNNIRDPKQKLEFIEALLKKQFWGIEPTNLSYEVGLTYNAHKYNIDQQVKGYEDKMGYKLTPPQPPTEGGIEPPTEPPTLQEQEQEQVKEKEKDNNINNTNSIILEQKKMLEQLIKNFVEEGYNSTDAKSMANDAMKLISKEKMSIFINE